MGMSFESPAVHPRDQTKSEYPLPSGVEFPFTLSSTIRNNGSHTFQNEGRQGGLRGRGALP